MRFLPSQNSIASHLEVEFLHAVRSGKGWHVSRSQHRSSIAQLQGVGVGGRVGGRVGGSVGEFVGAFVGGSVGASVGGSVGAFVGGLVGASVGGSSGISVGGLVGGFVVESLRGGMVFLTHTTMTQAIIYFHKRKSGYSGASYVTGKQA